MMIKHFGAALCVCVGLGAVSAEATSIADLDSTYRTVMEDFYTDTGFLTYEGPAVGDLVRFLDDGGATFLEGDITNPASFFFTGDFDFDFVNEVDVTGLSDSIIAPLSLTYLFETGTEGFLLTIAVPTGTDLTGTSAMFLGDATITIDKYTQVIPLPATLPMLLAGMGGIALLRRKNPR